MSVVRITTVCTANICRSPAAATLLRLGLASSYPLATVTSVGTAAVSGQQACELSSALIAEFVGANYPAALAEVEQDRHASRRMVAADFAEADLILALDRSHRSAVAQLHPASRTRTFTLRQAGEAAEAVGQALRAGQLPDGAPPLPDDPGARFSWWVAELDAIRAFLGGETINAPGGLEIDPLDVPDPHVEGFEHHPIAISLIEQSVSSLVGSLRSLTEFGSLLG